MSHYLDIHLRPDPQLATHHLLGALYGRLHRALAQTASDEIGVSFPGYDAEKPSLGRQLRLHGPERALQDLMAMDWLKSIRDYLKVGTVAVVPEPAGHRLISRAQVKSNAERLRRRAIKRHALAPGEVLRRIPDTAEKRLPLPFVTLGSASTSQASFPLFIRMGPLLDQPLSGAFNSYGLSRDATVPWF